MRKKKIIFIGDSLTEGFNLQKYFPFLDIINNGVYGDNTSGVLKRLQQDAINDNPDLVFVLIGTNDFALKRSINEIVTNLGFIVSQLKEHLPGTSIYLSSLLPTLKIDNRPNKTIKLLNAKIKIISDVSKINFCDLHYYFVTKKGNLYKKYTTDGLHLNEMGYEQWSKVMKTIFENQNILDY